MRTWALLIILALSCAFLTGCNNRHATYPVAGKIVFEDGSPAMFGDIEFQSTEHPINARGTIRRDGSFSLTTYTENDGAIAGDHKIVITQLIPAALPGQEIEHNHGLIVHKKYYSFKTSDLKANVEKQSNTLELVVEEAIEEQ